MSIAPELEHRIEHLPQWARAHIADLQRQRDNAVRALREANDSQTESAVYHEEIVSLSNGSPEYMRRYVQTDDLVFQWGGIQLRVTLRGKYDSGRERIVLQWGNARGTPPPRPAVAMQPTSHNQIELITADKFT